MMTITLNSWASVMPSWCLAQVPERNSIPGWKWIKGEFNEAVSECRITEQNVKLVWLSILPQPWARIIKLHLLSSLILLISGIITCKQKETSSLLEMLIEDGMNPKERPFLRKLGHQWLRIRIVKNANPSHLISLLPDKKLALNLTLIRLLSARDGPFFFFENKSFFTDQIRII